MDGKRSLWRKVISCFTHCPRIINFNLSNKYPISTCALTEDVSNALLYALRSYDTCTGDIYANQMQPSEKKNHTPNKFKFRINNQVEPSPNISHIFRSPLHLTVKVSRALLKDDDMIPFHYYRLLFAFLIFVNIHRSLP